MSLQRRLRRWRFRRREGALPLPARPGGRDPEAVGPLTSLRTPKPTENASERTGARLGLRLSATLFVVFCLFAVLLVRLWSLQVVQGPQLNNVARAETSATIQLAAPRGPIVTSDGLVLAGDGSQWQLVLAHSEAKSHPDVVTRLAALLHVRAALITTALSSEQNATFAPVPLPTAGAPVSDANVLYIEQNPEEFPGVTVTKSSTRSYPQGSLASQVIGYVNPIQSQQLTLAQFKGLSAQAIVGQSGLEYQYNTYLQGKPGLETFEVDPNGVPLGELSSTPAVSGDTLVLNLDGALEKTLTSALSDQLVALRYGANPVPAPWGAAVVLDTKTGAVLAMASAPGYNNNLWEPGISVAAYAGLNPAGCATGAPGVGCPLANYATQGLQPPGSTFKLATATAALDRGLINQYYSYDDTGSFTIGNPPLTLHDSDNEALGEVDVSTALSESSDVFFYNLGWLFWLDRTKYGETPIQRIAEGYGIGVPSAVDLPGALSGQVDSPQLRVELHRESPSAFPYTTYYAGDNVEMAFGQGETLTTPLELAEAYGTFANGGTRYAPELAGAIVSPGGKLVKRIAPKILDRVPLPPLTWQPIFSGLEGAVQSPKGTAYAAFQGFDFTSWDIGGKTGTATTCPNDLSCQPTSWFVGIGGPRGQSPRYVVAVEVNEGGFGAAASAPVARKVFDYLFAHQPPPLHLPSGH